MEQRTDARALRHPLWVGALAVLLVNDHVLKGAGLIDGAWTGKLSDFAGMIVAPVLVSALIGAKSPRRRAVAFLLVGGWFAAANLVPAVSLLTASAGDALGLGWQFVCDPTDLVALAVLPLAWHVASHRGAAFSRVTVQAWAERSAVGFGVAACVASPQPPDPSWRTQAFLFNDTGAPVEVRLRWVEINMDCTEVARRPAAVLGREAFAPGLRYTLEINETLPITRETAAAGGGRFPGEPFPGEPDAGAARDSTTERLDGPCDAVILSVDGLDEDRIIFWQNLQERAIPLVVDEEDERRALTGGLTLLRAAADDPESLVLVGPSYEIDVPNDRYEGGAACRDYGSISGFDWSGLPWLDRGDVDVRVRDVRPTLDGCVSLTFEELLTREPSSAFICVPPEDFPFLENAVVTVRQDSDRLHITQENRLDDGTDWRVGELIVVRGAAQLREGPFSVTLQPADEDCQGVRMDCGGFRIPTPGTLQLSDGVRFVHPGDAVERTDFDGRRARLRVGRAETLLTTRAACGAGRDQLGARLEALVVYGEEPR